MILTECPECDRPIQFPLQRDKIGAFIPHECPDCDCRMVIEQRRVDGTTYTEEYFLENVMEERGLEKQEW